MLRSDRFRRATCWLSLIGYTLVSGGLPLPAAFGAGPGRAGKDCSIPFPCMDSPCGCSTAVQCYASCCCHTPAQRRAWAKARGLDPIVDALLRLRADPQPLTTPLDGDGEPTSGTDEAGSHATDSSGTVSCCSSKAISCEAAAPDAEAAADCCSPAADSTPVAPIAPSLPVTGPRRTPAVRSAPPRNTARRPLDSPEVCSAYRQFATSPRSQQPRAEKPADSCSQASLSAPLDADRPAHARTASSAGRGPEETSTAGREHSSTVTLRAMLACGGIVAEWLNIGAGPPPLVVAEVVCLSLPPESISMTDDSRSSLRPAPDAPPPRAA
jgi:hypothetical protein